MRSLHDILSNAQSVEVRAGNPDTRDAGWLGVKTLELPGDLHGWTKADSLCPHAGPRRCGIPPVERGFHGRVATVDEGSAGFTRVWARDWYEKAAKAGAFTHADGISYHGYEREPGEMRKKHELFRDIAKRFGPKDREMELWNTEWGVRDTTFYVDADFSGLPPKRLLPQPSFLEGAARVVKTDCVAMALGVKRSFYYLHNAVENDGAYHNISAIEVTTAPRPKLIARVALESLVRGAKAEALVEKRGLKAVVFSKNDGTSLAALWLVGERKAKLAIPNDEEIELFDLFANPLPRTSGDSVSMSHIPVYIRTRMPANRLAAFLSETVVSKN